MSFHEKPYNDDSIEDDHEDGIDDGANERSNIRASFNWADMVTTKGRTSPGKRPGNLINTKEVSACVKIINLHPKHQKGR